MADGGLEHDGIPTSKSVILLGAGASAGSDFHLPVMDTLLDRATLEASEHRTLKLAIQLFAGDMFPINIEELLTHLDLTEVLLDQRWKVTDRVEFGQIAERARFELEEYLTKRLSHRPGGSTDHIELFRKLRQQDSVLTLNYDRVADDSLMVVGAVDPHGRPVHTTLLGRSYALLGSGQLMAGTPAGLTSLERANGFFLKLHGSVSWLSCPNPTCARNQEIVELFNERDAVRPEPGDPCRFCGTTLYRLIVAPTLGKQFVETPRLELLWHLAYRELLACTELVVVGVSLPPSDTRLRWLLSSAYLRDGERTLIVVNPDDEAVARVESACRTKASATFKSMAELNARWSPEA